MFRGFHQRIGALMAVRAASLATALGFAVGLWLPGNALAETVRLAAGEYAPFVGKQLVGSGVTAAIVAAAFKDQGVDVELDFLPWQRGYMEAAVGKYVGTFPYLKTAQRETEFYFSEPILNDRFRMFVRDPQQKISDWKRGVVCVPLGYDTTQIQAFRDAHRLQLERPAEISNCVQMLDFDRVGAVWGSELVIADTVARLLGPTARFYPMDLTLVGESKYYLMVSRTLPGAKEWLVRFDAGLRRIRASGLHRQIVQKFSAP